MKKSRRSTFFIVAVLIIAFAYLSLAGFSTYYGDNKIVYLKGVNDIRWGIDIQGGVEAVFTPDIEADEITTSDMQKAEEIIKRRLTSQKITDSEINRDDINKQIIVRFPWQNEEENFDPAAAVEELGRMAVLTFNTGDSSAKGTTVLEGKHIASASLSVQDGKNMVALKLTPEGADAFEVATSQNLNKTISIWLDDQCISSPTVDEVITTGEAVISGDFTADEAQDLANTINAGSLPFALSVDDSSLRIVSPTLGQSALQVMLIAGIIAYLIILIMMIAIYRLPGVVAAFAITCQIAGVFAAISGFLPFANSFTLTIPGLAGIILSIGMGVDANVINAERVKDELNSGRTIDGSIKTGFKRGFGAIIDGNVTVVIVSIILMGAFGSPDSIWAKIVSPFMFMFNSSITGSIYSFGYTLLIGAIFNLLIGVGLSKIMIQSLSSFKCLRKPWLFGGKKNAKNV